MLGRFSSNKFGVVLASCTPDDLTAAADRFLSAVREDVVQTVARPGRRHRHDRRRRGAAPRAHRRRDDRARAGIARLPRKPNGAASFVAYRPNIEREALRRENAQATDKIVTR